jgi:competence protein ComEC
MPWTDRRDVLLSGVVTDMPKRNEAALRFTLAVDDATMDGTPVHVPPRVDVGWYAGVYSMDAEQMAQQRQPDGVGAGERWRMAVRIKAPNGSRNPSGFDYER